MGYSFEQLLKGIRRPRRGLVELKGIAMNQLFGGNFGDYIMEQDWDNLIILDACRYDLFKQVNPIEGQLHRFHSRGCHTGEFVQQNFQDGTFLDTVYVSSNPNPAEEANAEFASVEEVWESGWDESLHTVPPEITVERTIDAEDRFPNKRLISHFVPPHYPWIGPEGREFMSEHGYAPQNRDEHIWVQMRTGEADAERVWNVYEENLRVTIPHVQELVNSLDGKTVVTSDHGNAFGEWGVYGHPPSCYISPLVQVPWLEVPYDERKNITSARTGERFTDEEPSKEQLRDLGYVE